LQRSADVEGNAERPVRAGAIACLRIGDGLHGIRMRPGGNIGFALGDAIATGTHHRHQSRERSASPSIRLGRFSLS